MKPLVLDVETQKSFDEVGGKAQARLLGISLVGVYDYETDSFDAYGEERMQELEELIKARGMIIGFNTKHFDYTVMQPYFKSVDLSSRSSLDILLEIEAGIGYRVKLERVAHATLGEGKSGHGLEAIRLWREGKIEELKKYCLDDVRITRDVYEFGKKHGEIWFEAGWEKYPVPVNWK